MDALLQIFTVLLMQAEERRLQAVTRAAKFHHQ